ncbi:MAG: Txe/YoeB family addiction module toxin [Clostridiales bacterium]|jgi:toxin YoeB|nr:Txe/YoeB family addiction module toxin [Clostridiales bacterium]
MNKIFVDTAWNDYIGWAEQDIKIFNRINELIRDTERNPFRGLGKPEPLKYDLSGYWSRRINDTHRLIYKVEKGNICIVQCRWHY